MFKEYNEYDATGLAALVAGKQVAPTELLDAAIDRAQRLNPQINAIITPMYDEARRRLEQDFSGPFMGVPFLLKDLLAAFKGVPLSSGSEAGRHFIPTYDSTIVTRFKAAGLNIFGKTNTPELGLMGVTEPEAFGPARNPWNTDHTPGGSSGGSAAAVAAGIVPMAAAGDGGGSIRIPSSCCGLFGLKPSRGRNPAGPDFGEVWDGAAVQHVISRSVRDSAAMLDITARDEPGSPYPFAANDRGSYLSAALQSPGPLKIGFSTQSPLGTDVHSDCVAAVEDVAALLQSLGHEVEPARPDIDGRRVAHCYLTMYMGHVAAELALLARVTGVPVSRLQVEDTTRALGMLGRALSAGAFVSAKWEWNSFARAMARLHRQYDLYMTPVTASPPLPVGYFAPGGGEKILLRLASRLKLGKWLLSSGAVDKMAMEGLEKLPFTQLANLTGQPAMSVPLYWTADDLPIGVQFTAPTGDEKTLLSLAGQLEQARPLGGPTAAVAGGLEPNMPEYPDITVYLEALERRILHHTLRSATLNNPFLLRTAVPPMDVFCDQNVVSLERIGKRIVIGFGGDLWMVFHLMVAGRLHWKAAGAKAPGKSALICLRFDSGLLYLTEAGTKRRASLHLVQGVENLRAMDPGGINVLAASLTEFSARLLASNHTLKRALTDPHIFSGIGNAYSDEILHHARLSPIAMTQKLTAEDIERLYRAVRAMLELWTDRLRRHYGDDFPEKVTAFRDDMAAHGRYGQPCPVCQTPIQRIRYATNETNYCPACQTAGKVLADRALSRLLKDWPRSVDALEKLKPS